MRVQTERPNEAIDRAEREEGAIFIGNAVGRREGSNSHSRYSGGPSRPSGLDARVERSF